MKKGIEILCTLGPSTLNRDFLEFSNKNVTLLRLNMSHIEIDKLKKIILFIRRFSKVPICIDTEGAQIGTKVKKSRKYREKEKLSIFKNKGNFKIYPPKVFEKIKKNDFLSIGFDTLKVRVAAVNSKKIYGEILEEGLLANNMGYI